MAVLMFPRNLIKFTGPLEISKRVFKNSFLKMKCFRLLWVSTLNHPGAYGNSISNKLRNFFKTVFFPVILYRYISSDSVSFFYLMFFSLQIMVIYNIFCVFLSFVAAFLLIYGAIGSGKIYAMEENEFVRQGLMVYTISKNVELLDTIFMILRQRWRQVSFLHVSGNVIFFRYFCWIVWQLLVNLLQSCVCFNKKFWFVTLIRNFLELRVSGFEPETFDGDTVTHYVALPGF